MLFSKKTSCLHKCSRRIQWLLVLPSAAPQRGHWLPRRRSTVNEGAELHTAVLPLLIINTALP